MSLRHGRGSIERLGRRNRGSRGATNGNDMSFLSFRRCDDGSQLGMLADSSGLRYWVMFASRLFNFYSVR
jgi:hypothetical protein